MSNDGDPTCTVWETDVFGDEYASALSILDFDCRRSIKGMISSLPCRGHPNDSIEDLDYDGRTSYRQDVIEKVIAPILPHLSRDITAVEFTSDAQLLSLSTKVEDDITEFNYYPPFSAYGAGGHESKIGTVLRSELTELQRFSPGRDVVSYDEDGNEKCVVFNYHMPGWSEDKGLWELAHILMALSYHPNIPTIDRLVLEEITKEGVVGFTNKFIPGGTFFKNRSRVFKLKWLRQLMATVDDLNLKHGLVHQDIVDRNLLVDSDTDTIQVIDFGEAFRVGSETRYPLQRYWPELDDIKGVIVFLNSIITANPKYINCRLEEVEEPDINDLWVKHPDVQLDHDSAHFQKELRDWVTKRRSATQLAHYTQAPRFIEWPPEVPARPRESVLVPPPPMAFEWETQEEGELVYPIPFSRLELLSLGRPYVGWERPSSNKVDRTRRLLATGRYADEKGWEYGFDIDVIRAEIAANLQDLPKKPDVPSTLDTDQGKDKSDLASRAPNADSAETLPKSHTDGGPLRGKKRKTAIDRNSDRDNGTGPRTRARARAEKKVVTFEVSL